MDKYDPIELILSIIYYGQGNYTPDEIIELLEIMRNYLGENDPKAKKKHLTVVPINTFDYE